MLEGTLSHSPSSENRPAFPQIARLPFRVSGPAFLMAVLVSIAVAGCTRRYERHWNELSEGMDQPTVRRLLGTPTYRIGPVRDAPATRPAEVAIYAMFFGEAWDVQCWAYGPPGLFPQLAHIFGPSSDAHVVYFDDAGRVTGWREPLGEGQFLTLVDPRSFSWRFAEVACAVDPQASVISVPPDQPATSPAAPQALPPPTQLRYLEDADRIVFTWDRPARAPVGTEYWIQIGTTDDTECSSQEPDGAFTFSTPRESIRLHSELLLIAESDLFWRVRAVHDSRSSDFSGWMPIKVAHQNRMLD